MASLDFAPCYSVDLYVGNSIKIFDFNDLESSLLLFTREELDGDFKFKFIESDGDCFVPNIFIPLDVEDC